MKSFISLLSFFLFISTGIAAELKCHSIDTTHYPYYEIRIEVLEDDSLVLLGKETSTEDFQEYTTDRFWFDIERIASEETAEIYAWDGDDEDPETTGSLLVQYLSNGAIKADLIMEGDEESDSVELSCKR